MDHDELKNNQVNGYARISPSNNMNHIITCFMCANANIYIICREQW